MIALVKTYDWLFMNRQGFLAEADKNVFKNLKPIYL
jgi:hypothetical protein